MCIAITFITYCMPLSVTKFQNLFFLQLLLGRFNSVVGLVQWRMCMVFE